MKDGWKTETLDDACEMYQPKTISGKDMVEDGAYPVYGANGVIGRYNQFNHEEPQLLITCRGATCGSVNISAPRSWVTGNAMVVRPKNGSLELHYLEYLFRGGIDISKAITGAAQPQITRTNLAPLEISYPVSVAEQRRIVGILDEAFAGIATAKANAEKNLQNARAIFESHLQSVFTQRGPGWKQKTLEEIAAVFGRGKSKHRPRNAPHLYGGKYPFVQTGDIRNADHIITKYSQTYSEAGLAQSKLWPKGTICITIAANIAETAILGFEACFPDSVIGVVANPKEAEIGFIEYLLQSFKTRIQAMGKGSAQANINMGTFENERFPFPPVTEQKQIIAKLDGLSEETQRLASLYEQKRAALEALKKSLLHQAFTGELAEKTVCRDFRHTAKDGKDES
jgi:type I restriction enzyme S subunit